MPTDAEQWKPHVTVAAVITDGERFLLVEEVIDGALRLNQPAGHLEPGESLIQAVRREALEEAAVDIEPTGIVGIYRWRHPHKGTTFLRTTFAARTVRTHPGRALDAEIQRTIWLTRDEILSAGERLRSPMVLRSVDDFLAGHDYPLALLREVD
ncbi:NUDIX hydrolase [Arhodomonas sp. AD133]|uniref:NUDIX hydrolase n=1 Tax=Arhodomonas sp. AD133 TaxID=3415009 RepID=UPI003EC04712